MVWDFTYRVWIVIRLKERLVKVFVENDHMAVAATDSKRGNQVPKIILSTLIKCDGFNPRGSITLLQAFQVQKMSARSCSTALKAASCVPQQSSSYIRVVDREDQGSLMLPSPLMSSKYRFRPINKPFYSKILSHFVGKDARADCAAAKRSSLLDDGPVRRIDGTECHGNQHPAFAYCGGS